MISTVYSASNLQTINVLKASLNTLNTEKQILLDIHALNIYYLLRILSAFLNLFAFAHPK